MLLTIDIGNTNITMGIYEDDELLFVSRLATDRKRTSDQYSVELLNIFKLHNVSCSGFSGAIISSVVPEVVNAVGKAVETVTGITPQVLDRKSVV